MAIRLADVYSNALPANSDYPGGGFKNSTSAGGQDGTPLDQAWANDFLGFFQALLQSAGVTPNGSPDTARASQYLAAMRMLTNPVGSTFFSPFWTIPPTGSLELNGDTIGSASAGAWIVRKSDAYRALFNLVWATTTIVINGTTGGSQVKAVNADADWTAGNGAILTDMRGLFPRGWDHGRGLDPGRLINTYQDDAQQNITGSFPVDDSQVNKGTGAFYNAGGTGVAMNNDSATGTMMGFDASREVRTADEVRVKSVSGMWVVRF